MQRFDEQYDLIRMLGKGAFAEVWLAWYRAHPAFEKKVAIKLGHEVASDAVPAFMAAFVREAQIGAALRHPCIVNVFDFGLTGGRPFIAMEYIEGITLRRWLSVVGRASLGLEVSLEVAHQVARALEYAHGFKGQDGSLQPVVHRDLKPENILVGWTGEVKLLDYSIARWSGNAAAATMRNVLKGTPQYMSPEQIEEPASVGPSSDLFSLGAILLEMLTGRTAFAGINIAVLAQNIIAYQPEEQFDEVAEMNPGTADLVRSLLRKAPADRPSPTSSVRNQLMDLSRANPMRGDVGAVAKDQLERLAGSDCVELAEDAEIPPVRATEPGLSWESGQFITLAD
jgi:serine/threonine protein kinase